MVSFVLMLRATFEPYSSELLGLACLNRFFESLNGLLDYQRVL